MRLEEVLWKHHSGKLSSRPEIVVLCGSTRFVDAFNYWREQLTLQGMIVLSIEVVTTQRQEDDPQLVAPEVKCMLDLLHLEKIRMADFVFVINVGGYIGESTANEIDFAKSLHKRIEYMEDRTNGLLSE